MLSGDGRRGRRITDRDLEILRWIGRHGMVTAEQVASKFFARGPGVVGTRAAYRRLDILEKLALIKRDQTPYWRAPKVVRVTAAGASLAGVGVRPARYVEGEVRHAVALVDLMEQLHTHYRDSTLRTEREIRTDRWHEQASGRRDIGRGRIPDGQLTLRTGRVVAVELDLTPKRSKDFERILRAYRQEKFDEVWWYVVPGAVDRVRKLVEDNRCDDFMDVRAIPALSR